MSYRREPRTPIVRMIKPLVQPSPLRERNDMDIGLLHHQLRNRLIADGISHEVSVDKSIDELHYRFIFKYEEVHYEGIFTLEKYRRSDEFISYLIVGYTLGDKVLSSTDGITGPVEWIKNSISHAEEYRIGYYKQQEK